MSRYLTKKQQKELTKNCKHMVVNNNGKIGEGCCSFDYMVCIGCDMKKTGCKYVYEDGHCKHPSIYTKLKVGGMLIG